MNWGVLARSAACAIVVVASQVPTALAFRTNPPPGRNGSTASGGATCRSCHGATVGTGSVAILGAPDRYGPNEVYDLTVRVSDATKLGAGFQLSVENPAGAHVGTLSIVDPVNTVLNATDPHWVNQTGTGVANSVTNWASLGSAAEFQVRWQAPIGDVGPITFWAVGNAINDNNSLVGDIVYLTSVTAYSTLIPTVSAWGMAAMTLCVLSAATLALRRAHPSSDAAALNVVSRRDRRK